MRLLNTNNIKVGDKLPELVIGPISRNSLTIYADASGDHNPIHIDQGLARQVGLPDVIAHGMLVMSYLGQVLTNNIDQSSVKEYEVKFSSMTNIGDVLTCNGTITHMDQTEMGKLLKIELKVLDQDNDEKLIGESTIMVS